MTAVTERRPGRARPLAALLLGMGVLHFVIPAPFDSVIPRGLPGRPRTYTYASGVAELGVGTAIALPRTRRLGGWLAALLFIAVFPANVQMAADWVNDPKKPLPLKIGTVLRLPLQIPLIVQALRLARAR
ncbi:hypothetical protein ACFYTQ_22670 [Nocardia sp. NPDC004068]|uniref:DoxX family protein n=1 Tax=Nocardia sp. NPDC004068 TaxID=3364303 RepID=UPI0036CE48AF